MVYHCTAYPIFTGQVLFLASSHVQRVKCGGDVHCTLGNINHPIDLQRTKPNNSVSIYRLVELLNAFLLLLHIEILKNHT